MTGNLKLSLTIMFIECIDLWYILTCTYHCAFRGDDFRKDYGKIGMLCASFPNAPVLALTATANKMDRKHVKESLGLKNCAELVANPDRRNIFY